MPPGISDNHLERLTSSRYVPPERGCRYPNESDTQIEPAVRRRGSGAVGQVSNLRAKGSKMAGRHVTFTPQSYSGNHRSLETRNIRVRPVSSFYTEKAVCERVVSHPRSLPERLKISKAKGAISPTERIEELTRENVCLRQEVTHYKETQAILIRSFQATKKYHRALGDSLDDIARDLAIAEQPLREYWGLDSGGKDEIDRIF